MNKLICLVCGAEMEDDECPSYGEAICGECGAEWEGLNENWYGYRILRELEKM